jgi:hypothetical protein
MFGEVVAKEGIDIDCAVINARFVKDEELVLVPDYVRINGF